MQKLARLTAVIGALFATSAHAQFANHSLGLTVGALSLTDAQAGLDLGVPIGLSASLYIENGFEVVFQVGVMIVHNRIFNSNQVALDGPTAGVRYLFMQESLRPYLGLDLSYLHLFGLQADPVTGASADADFFGLGPNLGVEYFVSDSISLGVKGRFNIFLTLNGPTWFSFGATASATTYF